jgi:hypothetical protein
MNALTVQQARRAYDLAIHGGASVDAQIAALRDLRTATEAAETLDERALRLGIAAADKDAEGERHMLGEADAAGRAASRRFHGNDDELARSFDREAAVCLKLADECFAEAERLRSQANAIRRRQRYAAEYVAIVSGVLEVVA